MCWPNVWLPVGPTLVCLHWPNVILLIGPTVGYQLGQPLTNTYPTNVNVQPLANQLKILGQCFMHTHYKCWPYIGPTNTHLPVVQIQRLGQHTFANGYIIGVGQTYLCQWFYYRRWANLPLPTVKLQGLGQHAQIACMRWANIGRRLELLASFYTCWANSL